MIVLFRTQHFRQSSSDPSPFRVSAWWSQRECSIGAWLGGSYGERFGVLREDSYRTGTYMVLASLIGSRPTWVAPHTEAIENPIDVIAVWEGKSARQ